MLWVSKKNNMKPSPLNWGKMLLGAGLLVGTSSAAIAQNMVVRSVGPSAKSYPTGKRLAGGSKIKLKSQDKVTILGKSGTRVLKGPGTFTIGGRATARTGASTRLSSFINNRGRGRARTGAVRGGETTPVEPQNPNLWYLGVNQSGKFCVTNPNALILWRPDYTGSASASIVDPVSGKITKVEWQKSSPLKAWPRSAAPISDGAKYQLLGSNLPTTAEIDFVILDNAPSNPDDAAEMLIAKGCQSQLELLVDKLETDSTATQG